MYISEEESNENSSYLKSENIQENRQNIDITVKMPKKIKKPFEKTDLPSGSSLCGLLIDIRSPGSFSVSSFQSLSSTFRRYYSYWCTVSQVPLDDLEAKMAEYRAAVTYAILGLLFDVGYYSERIAVSGLDTLIVLAARGAMKLPDAYFAWKSSWALMLQGTGDIVEKLKILLTGMDIDFRKASPLVSIYGSQIQNPESIARAILVGENQNQQFLNNRMERYMVCGSTNYDFSMKIQKPQDFLRLFSYQKDPNILKTWRNLLLQEEKVESMKYLESIPENSISNLRFPNQNNPMKVSTLEIDLKHENYLLGHLVHNTKILSAATLLTRIHSALQQSTSILEDVTFLSPLLFTSEDETVGLEIKTSATSSVLSYMMRTCVSFKCTKFRPREPKDLEDTRYESGNPENCEVTTYESGNSETCEANKQNDSILNAIPEHVTVFENSEFYAKMEQFQYEYQGEFRSVQRLEIRNDSATVYLKFSEHLDVLIDGTMQAMVFSYIQRLGTIQSATLVPFHMQKIIITDIAEEITIPARSNIMAIFRTRWQNGRLLGSFELETSKFVVAAKEVSFYPLTLHDLGVFRPRQADTREDPADDVGSPLKRLEGSATDADILKAEELNQIQKDSEFLQESTQKVAVKEVTRGTEKVKKLLIPEGGSHREQDLKNSPEEGKSGFGKLDRLQEKVVKTKPCNIHKAVVSEKEICIRSFACRLPGNIHDPAELWNALKTGQLMASKIPCSRIETRDRLADGHYGHSVKCVNLLTEDVAQFDAPFFGISRSEAEKMDPQQRLLLECVQECMENAGIRSLDGTGFFVGLMANEYPEIVRKHIDVVSMLGSSASIASGRLNYVFRCTGPAVTLDTACSSSLVALQTAVAALRSGHCKTAIVGGVNLILTEESLGQRANGHLLAEDGRCRSFDAQASGYGRADGCVALLLGINGTAETEEGSNNSSDQGTRVTDSGKPPSRKYSEETAKNCNGTCEECLITVAASAIGHNGRSASLTTPSGRSQEKLLQECLRQIGTGQQQVVDYWETHGTGTVIGDAIELKALQGSLQPQCIISSAKVQFGHPEAAAGAVGLAKLLLQFRHAYIPEHGCYHFSENFENGILKLPIVGQEWTGNLAGLSSFGISGTNAMMILRRSTTKNSRSQEVTENLHTCFCPVSAKSKHSLQQLAKIYKRMLNESFHRAGEICAAAALQRNHMQYRAVIWLHRGKVVGKTVFQDEPDSRIQAIKQQHSGVGLEISSRSCLLALYRLYSIFPRYRSNFNAYLHLVNKFIKQQPSRKFSGAQKLFRKFRGTKNTVIVTGLVVLISFLHDIGIEMNRVCVHDNLALLATLLSTGKLKITDTVSVPMTFPDMQIYIPEERNRRTLDFSWYHLFPKNSQQVEFEHELMNLIASSYLHGNVINWEHLYSAPRHNIILPNYQFNRTPYWISKRPHIIDHWLLGKLIKIRENKFLFENQISQMTNPELFAFQYDGQMRLSFGICCEAFIEAVRIITALDKQEKASDPGKYDLRRLTVKYLRLTKYDLQEGVWIRTKVMKNSDKQDYGIQIACAAEVICEAQVQMNDDNDNDNWHNDQNSDNSTHQNKALEKLRNENITSNPEFYEKLKSDGLIYKRNYQVIGSSSSDGKIFVAKSLAQMFVAIEIVVQVACYINIIRPEQIYGVNEFKIKNLTFYSMPTRSAYVKIANSQITVYNEKGLKVIGASFKTNGKPMKLENENAKRKKTTSKQIPYVWYHDRQPHSITQQECIGKVRRAVEDIRNDDRMLRDEQLSSSFTELGLDSLAITDLANRLQTVYFPGLQVSAVDLFNYSSIQSLADAIHSRKILRNSGSEHSKDNVFQWKRSSNTSGTANSKEDRELGPLKDRNQESQRNQESEVKNCGWTQIFFEHKSGTAENPVTITNQERRPNKNEFLLIADNGKPQKFEYQPGSRIMHLDTVNPEIMEDPLLSEFNKRKTVTISFELSNHFPLVQLTKILLFLTKVISKSSSRVEFSGKPGKGQANAFALGFAKSLTSEFYPKVQYKWDFCLQNLAVKKYATDSHGTPEVPHTDDWTKDGESWLITGGLGGIGWQMAQWITKNRNVSHLILLGRRQPSAEKCREISRIRERAIDVQVVSVDLTSRKQVNKFFSQLPVSLTGIIHSAGSIHDTAALNQTVSTFREAAAAKCDGLLLLSQMCRTHQIRHFIVNSSISAVIGNRGQCNYSAANAYVDEFMLERRTCGLPATVINWGNWLETGMAVKINNNLLKMGFTGLTTKVAMAYLQYAIEYKPARIIVAALDVRKILRYRPDLAVVFQGDTGKNQFSGSGKFVPESPITEKSRSSRNQRLNDHFKGIKSEISDKNMQTHRNRAQEDGTRKDIDHVKSVIAETLEKITGVEISPVDFSKSFLELGLESLKMYRFVNSLVQRVETVPPLNILTLFENPTVEQLSRYVMSLRYGIREDPEAVKREAKTLRKSWNNRDRSYPGARPTNFTFLVLHADSLERLRKLKNFYLEQLEYSSKTLQELENRFNANAGKNSILQIIWGQRRKALKESFLHPETVPNKINLLEKRGKSQKQPKICFMFSGHGSQAWNIGRQLAEIFPVFRKTFDETLTAANKFMPQGSMDFRNVLYQWNYRHLLYKTEYAQPIIYCFGYSLAKLYEACGVTADIFVGHSVGELVAYTLAGRITWNEALKLVLRRGQILAHIEGKGKMIAVKKSDVRKLRNYSGMSRAAENTDKQIILSGDNQSTKRCLHFARKHGCTVTIIDDSYPFHSFVVDDLLCDKYKTVCEQTKFLLSDRKNIVSYCSGQFPDDKVSAHPQNAVAPISAPVLFKKCVETIRDHGTQVWLEIGYGEVLSTMVRGMLGNGTQKMQICSAMRNGKHEVDSFIESLLELHKFGVTVSWKKVYEILKPETLTNLQQTNHWQNWGKYNELIEQHLINGEEAVPAAVVITIFAQFVKNELETNDCKFPEVWEPEELLSGDRGTVTDGRTIILEKVTLEKRLDKRNFKKLRIKNENSSPNLSGNKSKLILTDGYNNYCSCQLMDQKKDLNRGRNPEVMVFLNNVRNSRGRQPEMTELTYREFYETMRKRGMKYGPKFDILRNIRRKGSYIQATIIKADSLTVLLDGALQTLSAAVFSMDSAIYIPFVIDKIWINFDNFDKKVIINNPFDVYGVITERTDKLIKGSAVIYQNQHKIVILHNVIAIRVDESLRTHPVHKQNLQLSTDPKVQNATDHGTTSLPSSTKNTKSKTVRNPENKSNRKISVTSKSGKVRNSKSSTVTQKIEIVSYAGVFPGFAVDSASLWNYLKTETGSPSHFRMPAKIRTFEANIAAFNPEKFGISPKEAVYIDPQQRILLQLAQKVIEKAGIKQLDSDTGVFIGVSSSDFAQKAYGDLEETSGYLSTGTNQSALAGRIAYWFNLTGPALVIDTACSSFFAALATASDNIKRRNCRAALVGAVNVILNSKTTSVLEQAQMLSKTGSCKVFDADADGYVRADGAAMFLIQGTSKVGEDPDPTNFSIEAYSMRHIGRSNGLTVPSSNAERELMNAVIRKAGGSMTIGWVEAHATGTPLGDPIEANAIAEAIKSGQDGSSGRSVHVTSVKSSIGHCEAAAGAASLTTILMALENGYLPPVQHFRLLNRNIRNEDGLMIPVIGEELTSRIGVLINSFGFSGAIVSFVIKGCKLAKYFKLTPTKKPTDTANPTDCGFSFAPQVLLLSGGSLSALRAAAETTVDYLQTTDQALPEICESLQKFRNGAKCRTAQIIVRHTQKIELPFKKLEKSSVFPEKWKNILFRLENTVEPALIAELYKSYQLFRKIFTEYVKTYQCAKYLIKPSTTGKFAFQFTAKLSLLTFLIYCGIQPRAVLAKSSTDRVIAQTARRKFRTQLPSKTSESSNQVDFQVLPEIPKNSFDCTISLHNLLIEKPSLNDNLKSSQNNQDGSWSYQEGSNSDWKESHSKRFANTLCSLYEHFVDINWEILNVRTFGVCKIPEEEGPKKYYWPFVNNKQNGTEGAQNTSIAVNCGRQNRISLPESEYGSNNVSNSGDVSQFESGNNQVVVNPDAKVWKCQNYIYKLGWKKHELSTIKQISPFAAVNLSDLASDVAYQACFTGRLDSEHEIPDIKEKLHLHKCRKILLEWNVDVDNLLESTIRQSIQVINLWKLLEESGQEFRKAETNSIRQPCLVVYMTNERHPGANSKKDKKPVLECPCSGLLKTLAAERPAVRFKLIITDATDQHLLDEIHDETSYNEIVYHNSDGKRYLERLERYNFSEKLVPLQLRRILITGSATGIAKKLVETLKPRLTVIVARSAEVKPSNNNESECLVKRVQADCANYEQLKEIFATFAPFDAVFHCAAVVDNALMENMDVRRFEKVCRPKVLGLMNIIKVSRKYKVGKIVAFSSAATVLGSAGQANYVVANGLMAQLMSTQVPDGLTVSWGPWNTVGMLSGEQLTGIRNQIQQRGWNLMDADDIAQTCYEILGHSGHYIAMDANFTIFRRKFQYLRKFLEHIQETQNYETSGETALTSGPNPMEEVEHIQETQNYETSGETVLTSGPNPVEGEFEEFDETKRNVREMIKKCITEISGIEEVKSDVGFMSMGIDSLMIADIRETLNERLNSNLTASTLYEHCTLDTLTSHIARNLPTETKIPMKVEDVKETNNVAIISYSGAFSGSSDDEAFWRNLLDGKETIGHCNSAGIGTFGIVPDIDKFDYRFWKMSLSDANYLDPQIRKFVEHAYLALERSGLVRLRNKLRIAVVVGAEPSEYRPETRGSVGGLEPLYEMNQKDFVAAWTSHLLDLHGPSFGVYSACSSALVALVQAISLLRNNQCDAAIAGAVSLALPDAIDPEKQSGMILSADGHCRPFDHKSGGTVRGSAVGALVLRRFEDAKKGGNPMILKIQGYGVSNDGQAKSSFMAPNVSGQRRCMEEAVRMAGTSEVDYIECHGTGTSTGDLIELTAMSEVYNRNTLIGSVKANIGHALAGAAVASIIKICKIAETGTIPRQINFEKLNENLESVSFKISQNNIIFPEGKKLRLAATACGIGGTNAHVILESVNPTESSRKNPSKPEIYALTVSGKTEVSCVKLCHRIAEYLNRDGVDFSQVVSTLQNYREHFDYRIAVTAKTVTDAVSQMKNITKAQEIEELRPGNIAFYFAPQGLEYANMGAGAMMEENTTYLHTFQTCCALVTKLTGVNFYEIIHPEQAVSTTDTIASQPYSQLAMFVVCYSVAEQLRAWGIEPGTMIGHSLGEYVAAAQAGVFDLETAIRILLERGRLIAKTAKAKMLAVKSSNLRPSEISTTNLGQELFGGTEVCAVLSQQLECLVGGPSTIEKLKEKLLAEDIQYRELVTDYGFHSSFMDPVLAEFEHFLDNFSFRKPQKQILSSIDGQPLERFDKAYMVKHLRSMIRLDKCIENLRDKISVIVEIGPKGILQSILKEHSPQILVIPTLPSKKQYEHNDKVSLLAVVAKLWAKGFEVKWENVCENYGFDRNLPNYQFEKDVCWDHQNIRHNEGSHEVGLYKPCWVRLEAGTQKRVPSGVLLFAPEKTTKIADILTNLHNFFIPVQTISYLQGTEDVSMADDGRIRINITSEQSYRKLADYLRNNDFRYDTIIHAWNILDEEDYKTDELLLFRSFHSVRWIIAHLMQISDEMRLLVAINRNAKPEMYTVLGPVREIAITLPAAKGGCVLCGQETDLFESLQTLETPGISFSCMRCCMERGFEYLSYCPKLIPDDECLIQKDDLIVIFGGFGHIGQSYIKVLCQKFCPSAICVASREASKHFQNLQEKIRDWGVEIRAYDVDIANDNEVQHFLGAIVARFGRINVIIHASGQATVMKLEKSFGEMQSVLRTKIHGTQNIITALNEQNISVRSLILNSSMNAILGIPGNQDYAAANVFLDELSQQHFANIQNVLSIQWTGWRNSPMLQEYIQNQKIPQNSITSLIRENTLPTEQAEEMIQKCLYERGVVTVSHANPVKIVREILKATENFRIITPKQNIVKQTCDKQKSLQSKRLNDIVAEIWKNSLGVSEITSEDNFFQLGGHSLNGMQIIWEINRTTGIPCKLDDLFENSKFTDFVEFLRKLDIQANPQQTLTRNLKSFRILDETGKPRKVPLTYSQENMYILRQLEHPALYNICFLITFRGSFCQKSMRKALLFLIARQTSLRTSFPASSEGCYQEIRSLTESYYYLDWAHIGDRALRQKMIEEEKLHIMDLDEVPLRILSMVGEFREITDVSPDKSDELEFAVVISQHHIITDGWSMTIFAAELAKFYHYCFDQQQIPKNFKKLAQNMAHFATWQRSQEFSSKMDQTLEKLCKKLNAIQATRIITHKAKSATVKLISRKTYKVPSKLWDSVIRKAKECQQTVYIVMLTAFVCLIRRFSDDFSNNTVLIGCPVSGRIAKEMESVVGYFLNNVILVVDDVRSNIPGSDILEQVAKAVQDSRRFESVPFHLLVAKLSNQQQKRVSQRHPVFDIFFNYRHNLDYPRIDIAGVQSTVTQLTTNDAFDFACTIDETDQATLITFDYNEHMYSSQLISSLCSEYFKLLKDISQSGKKMVREKMAQNLQLAKLTDIPRNLSLTTVISKQSLNTDKLISLHYPSRAITYQELQHLVHTLSTRIQQFYLQSICENIRADTVVPICASSNSIIVPLLAVQMTGAAYAPIDPENAATIIAQLAEQINAAMLIVAQNDQLNLDIPILRIKEDDIGLSFLENTERFQDSWNGRIYRNEILRQRVQNFDASYVIFTSGSTGKPKAVCVANRNLLNFVVSSTRQIMARPKLTVYHSVNTIFDVSCVNIFTTLANSGCLMSAEQRLNATVEIARKGVKFAYLPSALFNTFQDTEIKQLQSLENLYVGGETPDSGQIQKCLHSGIRIRQIYGPTETTVWSLTNNCSLLEHESGRMIGKAMDNEAVHVLDPENEAACKGAIGELIICGSGVSRGYVKHLTGAFIENKLRSREDEVLGRNSLSYRTGDLVMQLDEKCFFLGRKDKQLKVRGYRVEPDEIEAVVRKYDPTITNVAALKNLKTESLVLFIEKKDNSCTGLKKHLTDRLLQFMVPQQIIVLQKMPLTGSGKIDVNRLRGMMQDELPESEENVVREDKQEKCKSGEADPEIVQEKGIIMEKLKDIWCHLLGIKYFEPETEFFAVGGHSLSLVLLRNKLREQFKFELQLDRFYKQPTLLALTEDVFMQRDAKKVLLEMKPPERILGSSRDSDHQNHPLSCTSQSVCPNEKDIPLNFINLRETDGTQGNLYMIHAIAGTIYPYYGILAAIPQFLNVYAIEYKAHYPSTSLAMLASFYCKHITEHSNGKSVHLMGHSLGGILAREVAALLAEENGKEVPFVVMLDSWCVGTDKIRVDTVKQYLQGKLKGLPNQEEYIKGSILLTKMLQKHQFSTSPVKIYLLKAKNLGNSAITVSMKKANLSAVIRAMTSNGWQRISTKPVDVFLVDGDHDSILQQHNIPDLTRIFARIYASVESNSQQNQPNTFFPQNL